MEILSLKQNTMSEVKLLSNIVDILNKLCGYRYVKNESNVQVDVCGSLLITVNVTHL